MASQAMHSPRSQSLVPAGSTVSYTMVDSSTQESVIMELTRRLGERDASIRSITQQKLALESFVQNQHQQTVDATIGAGAEAYDTLLAHYMEREQQLQVATTVNRDLETNLQELKNTVNKLQNDSALKKLHLQDIEEKAVIVTAKLVKLEGESATQREAMATVQDVVSKKAGVIDYMNKEKEEMIDEAKQAEKTVKKLKDDIVSYKELVTKTEERVAALQESEATILSVEDKNKALEEEVESLKEEIKKEAWKETHTIESKDALLNMQRQQMEEQEDLIKIYEKKFLAKNTNVPKIAARADEGDRVWAKIEEREKKFKDREIHVGVLHDENTSLLADKKRLQHEVDELKQCFEVFNLELSGTGDKVHMPWLLHQLRETVQLKEKVLELQEIIDHSGYTVKAEEAECDFKKKEYYMSLEMEKLTRVIDMLNGQVEEVEEIEIGVLLGKLDEALMVFGEGRENKLTGENLEIAMSTSSDILSLNTNDSYNHEEWLKSPFVNQRDFKGLMHPDHYAVMSSLAAGFGSLKTDGLCAGGVNHEDVDDEDEEDGVFDAEEEESVQGDEVQEEEPRRTDDGKVDIHFEKVLAIIAMDDEDPEDWRNWVSPPCSPCTTCTTATAE